MDSSTDHRTVDPYNVSADDQWVFNKSIWERSRETRQLLRLVSFCIRFGFNSSLRQMVCSDSWLIPIRTNRKTRGNECENERFEGYRKKLGYLSMTNLTSREIAFIDDDGTFCINYFGPNDFVSGRGWEKFSPEDPQYGEYCAKYGLKRPGDRKWKMHL